MISLLLACGRAGASPRVALVRRGEVIAVNVANIGRALPSFAVLVFALQILSIGTGPALVALVVLGALPVAAAAIHGYAAGEGAAKRPGALSPGIP